MNGRGVSLSPLRVSLQRKEKTHPQSRRWVFFKKGFISISRIYRGRLFESNSLRVGRLLAPRLTPVSVEFAEF